MLFSPKVINVEKPQKTPKSCAPECQQWPHRGNTATWKTWCIYSTIQHWKTLFKHSGRPQARTCQSTICLFDYLDYEGIRVHDGRSSADNVNDLGGGILNDNAIMLWEIELNDIETVVSSLRSENPWPAECTRHTKLALLSWAAGCGPHSPTLCCICTSFTCTVLLCILCCT